ncbi:MAG TPA: GGDEF domain-containing protein, partial [Ruminococcus flavefaciens]|nr:GGDEF domain-containing protein [Ruminococcus flavefaciens]
MQKRKKIAVIAADISNDYMNRILVGISEQSKALGYDVYAFVMTFNVDGEGLIQNGEENIFTLINSEIIDGILLLGG